MGKPLSMDLRERVLGAISGGMSRRAAAARFGVSAASAVRWAALQRDHGQPAAKPQGGDTCSATTEVKAARIWALYEATPDITIAELCATLAAEGVYMHCSAGSVVDDRERSGYMARSVSSRCSRASAAKGASSCPGIVPSIRRVHDRRSRPAFAWRRAARHGATLADGCARGCWNPGWSPRP